MILPWWERYDGLLEEELDAFQRAGMPAEVNPEWRAMGIVRLTFAYRSNTESIPLYAIYPDLFPFVRPQVYAADLDLARHRNPFGGNLCLIGRSSEYWSPHDRLADLVAEQMPKLLLAARRPAHTPSPVPEEAQAEPITGYLPLTPNSVVLVDSEWQIPVGLTHGSLTLAAEVTDRIGFKAYVTRLAGGGEEIGGLRVLANAWERTKLISGRWVQLAAPPTSMDPAEMLKAAIAVSADLERPRYEHIGTLTLDVVGLTFPEDLQAGVTGPGWLFVLRVTGKYGGTFLARAARAGERDIVERIPEMAGLRDRTVLLVGLGGIGGTVALELIRAGVSELRVVDHDVVDPGATVRWPLGTAYAGEPKVAAIERFAKANWPYAKVVPAAHAVGRVRENPNEPSERDVLDGLLAGVDLVFDASAEVGIHYLLSELAREEGIPYVEASTRNGAWGGTIARVDPTPGHGCWVCLEYAWSEGDTDPERMISVKPGDLHQPLGCADPTFTGTGFDVATIALAGVRLAIATLLRGVAGGYPDPAWDAAIINLRNSDGSATPPTWRTFTLDPHKSCPRRVH